MLKVSWEDILGGFEYAVLENKLSFKKKKLYCIWSVWYNTKPDKFYAIHLVLNRGMALAQATKINVKYLKI